MSGKLTLISSATASNSASVEFTSGIDSSYDEYQIWAVDYYAHTNAQEFVMQFSTDGGSGYGISKTTTFFDAEHNEADTVAALLYSTTYDLADSTGILYLDRGNEGASHSDSSGCGCFKLFSPSSTTKVKHFVWEGNNHRHSNAPIHNFVAGYINTTSAVDAIKVKMASGNITGNFYLFGVS